ncbi:MAG: hypothetical protein QOH73_1710 [Gaiellaceae bacterium]|jgi:aminoglycoside/choline kinase family phosphotransferase|nr:hypothetical protein [Gaiellaceae bacterium]
MSEDVTRGLPADLASLLRDQSIVVPQDAAVFELVAAWAKAPSATASAEVSFEPDMTLVGALLRQTTGAPATTGIGC